MSARASACIIVGISYADCVERGLLLGGDDSDDFQGATEAAAGEVGLSVHTQSTRFDDPDDLFIGVVFRERPTDAEVKEAELKVTAALPRLKELLDKFGEPSSGVETWLSASVD